MGGPIRTWSFDDLEFAVRWKRSTGEGLPAPLIITTNFESNDEYLTECRRIAAALTAEHDPELDAVSTALSRPDMMLSVSALLEPDSADEQALRIYAARAGDRCFVVDQLPGRTIYHAAGFTVTEYEHRQWVAAIVSRLPDAGAGRRAVVPIPEPAADEAELDGMDYSYGRSDFRDSFEDDESDFIQEFPHKPMTATGAIQIMQGRSEFGPAGRARRTVGWRDIADDGRYAIVHQKPYVARAADVTSFLTLLTEEIEEIQLVIDDERRSVCR
jgi:hypothetical protein